MLKYLTDIILFLFPELTTELLPPLFRTVLEISLTMAVVIALLLLLRPLLKKHYRAKWMYWVWLLLAVRLVMPVNFPLPAAPVAVSAPGMTIYRHETVRTNPGFHEFVLLSPEDYRQAKEREDAAVAAGAEMTGGDIKNYYSPVFTLSQIGGIIWCGGIGVVLILEIISYARFRRRVRRWESPLEDERFEALKAELGVKHLALAQCSAVSSPMVTGFLHPTLLLPEADVPEAVLRHELVHAKRRDLWYKLLLVFARAVHWFNPLVWLMARQASQDLELSCDEAVVAGRDESFRARYGRAILDAVDSGEGKERAPLTTYFHGGKKAMLERLQSIVNTKGKRRGAIALALAAILAVSASAACVISPSAQRIEGGIYTLSIPTDIISCNLTEVMSDDNFPTSYYEAHFWRYSGSGNIRRLSIPGFNGMSFAERTEALRPTDKALGEFEFFKYISPGGLIGIKGVSGWHQVYYFYLGGDNVLEFWLSMGSKGTGHPGAYFTEAEADAMLSSLMIGDNRTSNPNGNYTLSASYQNTKTLWHVWDTSKQNPVLLDTVRTPAEPRVIGGVLWSEDGKWAAVPSGDGGLRWNYRIFGIGKEGFVQDFPVTLDAMLSQDYTPVPDSMELRAMKFVDSYGGYPALALSYSLLDTEGNLQSGTLSYNCMPPEISAALTGYTPVSDVVQNTPLAPTQWADEIHTFSMPLPEGTVISPTDGTEEQIFTTPDGEELGRIYKTAERPSFNSGGVRIEDGGATYMYSWWDSSHSLYYHLELRQSDNAIPLTQRMADALTMDGKSVEHFSDADSSRGAYTQADVDSALEAARAYFAERDDVRLDKLWFDPEKLEMIEGSYPSRGVRTRTEIEGMMVLLCDYSYIGELPAAAPGREMTDWMLIFVRDSADASWVLDNEGY